MKTGMDTCADERYLAGMKVGQEIIHSKEIKMRRLEGL
jgi:hypothetical protein